MVGITPTPSPFINSARRYPLLATDYESLDLTAFLPVPLLDADDINTGSFDNMVETPPALGGSAYGPGDTYDDLTMISPTISVDSEINSVTFSFAPFEDPASGSTLIEILFTVSIQPTPYPDNEPLFFPAQSIENAGAVQASNSFSTLFVDQPELVVYKVCRMVVGAFLPEKKYRQTKPWQLAPELPPHSTTAPFISPILSPHPHPTQTHRSLAGSGWNRQRRPGRHHRWRDQL